MDTQMTNANGTHEQLRDRRERTRPMKQPPATEKQKAYIKFLAAQNRAQVPNLAGMSKAQARSEIGRLKIEERHKETDRKLKAARAKRRRDQLLQENLNHEIDGTKDPERTYAP
jgi:hypothetical protein